MLIVSIAILINWRVVSGEIIIGHDTDLHIQWLQHFSKEIQEGILYPRWLAGTNFGYGSPTFVFYPPLIYYVGSLLKISGLNITQSIAFLYVLPTVISGISFYFFGLKKWGKFAALTAAFFYMTCPYLILNLYSRAALPEAWGMAWIPLGLWLTDRAILDPKWRIVLAIFSALLALTHLPTLLLVTLFWIPYILLSIRYHSYKSVMMTLAAVVLGWGLVSFYLIPVILEKKLVSLESMKSVSGGIFENLIKPQQTPKWKTIRYIFKIYVINLTIFTIIALIASYKKRREVEEIFYWLTFSIIVVFLTTYWSQPLWARFETLQMVQFPWRLFGLLSFGVSAMLAIAVARIVKFSWKSRIVLLLVGLIFIYNIRNAIIMITGASTLNNPGRYGNATKYNGFNKKEVVYNAVYQPYEGKLRDVPEYRPLLPSGEYPPAPEIGQPPVSVIDGKAQVEIERWGSYKRTLKIEAQEPSTIRLRTYYYPAWHLYVDGQESSILVADDGTIKAELEPGIHTVELSYQWTKAFTLGVLFSILSSITMIIFWCFQTFDRETKTLPKNQS